MRPTDQEKIAIEKVTYYIHQSQKEGACHAIQRGTRVGQEAEGARGKCGQGLYCGFHGKEWVKQGKQSEDWLV